MPIEGAGTMKSAAYAWDWAAALKTAPDAADGLPDAPPELGPDDMPPI